MPRKNAGPTTFTMRRSAYADANIGVYVLCWFEKKTRLCASVEKTFGDPNTPELRRETTADLES